MQKVLIPTAQVSLVQRNFENADKKNQDSEALMRENGKFPVEYYITHYTSEESPAVMKGRNPPFQGNGVPQTSESKNESISYAVYIPQYNTPTKTSAQSPKFKGNTGINIKQISVSATTSPKNNLSGKNDGYGMKTGRFSGKMATKDQFGGVFCKWSAGDTGMTPKSEDSSPMVKSSKQKVPYLRIQKDKSSNKTPKNTEKTASYSIKVNAESAAKTLLNNTKTDYLLTPQKKNLSGTPTKNERLFSAYQPKYKPRPLAGGNERPVPMDLRSLIQGKMQANSYNTAGSQDKNRSAQSYRAKTPMTGYASQRTTSNGSYLKPEDPPIGSPEGVYVNKLPYSPISIKTARGSMRAQEHHSVSPRKTKALENENGFRGLSRASPAVTYRHSYNASSERCKAAPDYYFKASASRNTKQVQVTLNESIENSISQYKQNTSASTLTVPVPNKRRQRDETFECEEQPSFKSTAPSTNQIGPQNRPSIDSYMPSSVFAKGPSGDSDITALNGNIISTTIQTEEQLPTLKDGSYHLPAQYLDTEAVLKRETKTNQDMNVSLPTNIPSRDARDFPRNKCSCDGYSKTEETCKRAKQWILRRYRETEFAYLKETYDKILLTGVEEESCMQQIKKDLHRTFPKCKYYSKNGEGINALERVLNAFAKYDPQVGYVQGMNFLAGSLLYHAEEYLAFWLLVIVVENLEMRDVFLPKLPGLSKHCQIIDILIANHLPATHELFCKRQIRMEFFASEWIFSLFAGVLPLDITSRFYDKLFEQGWPFFYKLILAYLQHFERDMLDRDEFTEIMILLKTQNRLVSNTVDDKSKMLDWEKLFQAALKIEVDSSFIYDMHSNFDVEKLSFNTNFLKEVTNVRKSVEAKA